MNGVHAAKTKCQNSDVVLVISLNLLSASTDQQQVILCNSTAQQQFFSVMSRNLQG